MMDPQTFIGLLDRYLDNQCTPGERELVEKWFELHGDNADLISQLNATDQKNYTDKIYHDIVETIHRNNNLKKRRPRREVIAGAFALIALAGIFLFKYNSSNVKDKEKVVAAVNKIPLPPGTNGAVLILGNGDKITLDTADAHNIIAQTDGQFKKNGDSLLMYADAGNIQSTAKNNSYNTLITPAGKQYALLLPDGSKVWLNASSYIKFPAVFNGNQRVVEIGGEAYFEIVHNESKPFKVIAGGQVIEDIGTVFDVNAYRDEPNIKATLVSGSIKINNVSLKPNQQAIIQSGKLKVVDIDAANVTAWRNGYFIFDNTSLEELMRQVSRWYNVKVEYEGAVPDLHFGGGITRHCDASQVLSILEQSNIHFKIENQKIIVMPE